MDIETLRSKRAELTIKTDMMEAAGVNDKIIEDDYRELEALDYALWQADFGDSMDALCTLPPSPLPPRDFNHD